MAKSYPESFQSAFGGSLSAPGGSFGKFDYKNSSGCQLASVGPRNLIKKIKFYIPSMGMGFDYSNTNHTQ